MPDFAPNFTPRYRAHYTVVGRPHSIMARGSVGQSVTDVANNARALFFAMFNAIAASLADDFVWTAAEAAATASDLFFPSSLPNAVVGGNPIANFSGQDSISHLTFSGRGSGGPKVSMKMYGIGNNPDNLPATISSDFVITAGESAAVAAIIAALNSATQIRAIDGSQILWRSQATLKANDYWLRILRKGG